MRPPLLYSGVASLLLPLAACMNMSGVGGDSHYACKAPEGVTCESVSGTYANAIHNNLPSQQGKRPAAPRQDETEAGPHGSAAPASLSEDPSAVPQLGDPVVTASPLRSQGRVLRLWIKPWEDADGDLYDQGYVYVQVDNGQWLIDHVQRQIRETYAPLRRPPQQAAEAPAESTAPVSAGSAPVAPLSLQRPPTAGAMRTQ